MHHPSMWKFRLFFGNLHRAFGLHPRLLNARIMQIAVLYEDLRLENLALSEESIPFLDKSGVASDSSIFFVTLSPRFESLQRQFHFLIAIRILQLSELVSTPKTSGCGIDQSHFFDGSILTYRKFATTSAVTLAWHLPSSLGDNWATKLRCTNTKGTICDIG